MTFFSLPYSPFLYYYIGDITQNVFVDSMVFKSFVNFNRFKCNYRLYKKKKTSSNASLPDVFRRGEKLCSAVAIIGRWFIGTLN